MLSLLALPVTYSLIGYSLNNLNSIPKEMKKAEPLPVAEGYFAFCSLLRCRSS